MEDSSVHSTLLEQVLWGLSLKNWNMQTMLVSATEVPLRSWFKITHLGKKKKNGLSVLRNQT